MSHIETSTPRFTPPELSEADHNEGRSTVRSSAKAEYPGGLPPPQLDDTKDFDTDEIDTETDHDYEAIPTSVKGDFKNLHEALTPLREHTQTKTTKPTMHLQRTTTTRTGKSEDKSSGTQPVLTHSTTAGIQTPTRTATPKETKNTGIVDREPNYGTSAPGLTPGKSPCLGAPYQQVVKELSDLSSRANQNDSGQRLSRKQIEFPSAALSNNHLADQVQEEIKPLTEPHQAPPGKPDSFRRTQSQPALVENALCTLTEHNRDIPGDLEHRTSDNMEASEACVDPSLGQHDFTQNFSRQIADIHEQKQVGSGLAHRSVDGATRFKEKFSGAGQQNIKAFLTRFDRFCKNQGHSDPYKCNQMDFILDGEAHDAYISLSDETKSNYPALRKQMITIFGPARLPPGESYQKVFKMKKEEGESVQNYYNNIMRICEQLPNASPELKMEIFTSGLPQYIRYYLRLNKPTTIEEALEKAKSAEAVGPDKDDQGQDIREMQQRIENLIGKSSAKGPTISAFENTQCFWCQKHGHLAKECPEKLVKGEAIPRNQQICSACYKRGHNVTVCFKMNNLRQLIASQDGRAPNPGRFSQQQRGTNWTSGRSRLEYNMQPQRNNYQVGNRIQGRLNGYNSSGIPRPFVTRQQNYHNRPTKPTNNASNHVWGSY